MTIKEYQLEASRTNADLGTPELNYLHMKMGVMTEIGEIVDILKKHLAYKKKLDLVHIGEEIADCAWYIVNWDTINGIISSVQTMANTTCLEEVLSSLDFVYGGYSVVTAEDCEFTTEQQLGLLESIANYFNLDFYELLDKNIAKLRVRFPEKFTEEAALNRNLEQERIELEK